MSNILKNLYRKVKLHKGIPPAGWLTCIEYAERLGCKPVQINKAVKDGRIPRKHLALNDPPDGQRRVIINWDASIYDYLIKRRACYRPDDFEPNKARLYKPFNVAPHLEDAIEEPPPPQDEGEQKKEPVQNIVDETLVDDEMRFESVIDTTSAKYRKEQLDIIKKQNELKREANELIAMSDERMLLGGLAAQLGGNASKAVPKWSPIFAAEKDPRKIRQLMKQMFTDIFKPLDEEVKDGKKTEN